MLCKPSHKVTINNFHCGHVKAVKMMERIILKI